jgi:hypothetical protein
MDSDLDFFKPVGSVSNTSTSDLADKPIDRAEFDEEPDYVPETPQPPPVSVARPQARPEPVPAAPVLRGLPALVKALETMPISSVSVGIPTTAGLINVQFRAVGLSTADGNTMFLYEARSAAIKLPVGASVVYEKVTPCKVVLSDFFFNGSGWILVILAEENTVESAIFSGLESEDERKQDAG